MGCAALTLRRAPAARSTIASGEMRSTSTSTSAGRPCCSGMSAFDACVSSSSTRTRPSCTSPATSATRACGAAVLGPRKACKADARRLSGVDAAQGDGRLEKADDPERSVGYDRADAVAWPDDSAECQRADFGERAADRRSDVALCDLVVHAVRGRRGLALRAFERRDFIAKTRGAREAVLPTGVQILIEAIRSEAERCDFALLLLGLLLSAQRVELAHKAVAPKFLRGAAPRRRKTPLPPSLL